MKRIIVVATQWRERLSKSGELAVMCQYIRRYGLALRGWVALLTVALLWHAWLNTASGQARNGRQRASVQAVQTGLPLGAVEQATVNFTALAEREAAQPAREEREEEKEPPEHAGGPVNRPIPEGATIIREEITLPAQQAPLAPSPVPAANFLALEDNNGNIPPDTHGAVGPNHLMVALNTQVRILNRNGQTLSTVSMTQFWENLSNPKPFDPKLSYDSANNRWIFVCTANSRSADSSVLVGVSQTGDPGGNWNLYRFDADSQNTTWADYPSVGFNKDWLVVSVNMFNNADPGGFARTQIFVFTKNRFYTAANSDLGRVFTDNGFTQAPATVYDNTTATVHLIENWNSNDSGNGVLRVKQISGAVGAETLGGEFFVTTPNPWRSSPATGGDFAPQLGSSQKIQNNDSRMMSVVNRNGMLWCAHTVFLPAASPTHSAVQWWQISPGGSVQQRGRIEDTSGSFFYAFPSIAVNRNGDALLGYTSFAATQYATASYSFRAAADAPSTMRDGVSFRSGRAPYYKTFSGNANRWGDYSNTVVDPANDTDFWTIQEYAEVSSGGFDRWGTWWSKIVPSGAPSSVTVSDHRMAIGPIPSGCAPPTVKTNFATTDDRAYQWTSVANISSGDVVRWEFVQPNGSIYQSSDTTATFNGGGCFWSWINISGNPPATLQGNWLVRVYYNNSQILTENFSIGTQTPPNLGTVELAVDDGSFENSITLTQGGTSYRANRLAPPVYPATITAAKIFFASDSGVTVGTPFTLFIGTNPDGDTNIDGLAFQTINVTVQALGQFNTYTVPQPMTIGSGDFVVGLRYTATSTGVFPFAIDLTPPSQRRSYRSTTGFAWEIIDDSAGAIPGNYGFHAVVQIPQQCSYSISPQSQSFGSGGGTGSVGVTTSSGCQWTASSKASWLTINSGNSGSGSGTVIFSAVANQSVGDRTGTLTVAGQTFTVTQSGLSCSYSISPQSQNFGSGGGTGSVGVTTSNGCQWTASSNASWLTINSGNSGSGSGTVSFSAAANQSGGDRTGTLTVAGQTFTVTQSGLNCSYSISPQSQNSGPNGGAGSVSVSTSSGCQWTASSNASWLTIISGFSGSGSGSVNYGVGVNSSPNSRTGTMTVSGQTFTVIQSGTANTQRLLRVSDSSGAPGSAVAVPIELVSQGDENALGLSLTFDPSVLSAPQLSLGNDAAGATLNTNTLQTGNGRIGLTLALAAGQTFQTGTKRILVVSFTIAGGASAATQIGFGDQPVVREISGVNADVLPANFTPGTVSIAQGYEADVAPRPNGNNNGTVTVTDWVQVGRFVAGLDVPAAGSELQRADCAPRATLGDGRISITDLTQAGRYSAGLDPVTAAGGPTVATGNPVSGREGTIGGLSLSAAQQTRNVRIATAEHGQKGSWVIEFDAQGNENAFGFSLTYDPGRLRFLSASLGKDATGAMLNINTAQTADGRVGFVLALPAGQAFAASTQQLLVLNFTAITGGDSVISSLGFGDQPIARELADVGAAALPVSFSGGSVTATRMAVNVSAASFSGTNLASETITAVFGSNLATTVQVATDLPLPTELGGTSVRVRDSLGVERLAPLFFTGPAQVNFLMPPGTAVGDALITVTSGDGIVSTGKAVIGPVAPGLFSTGANGTGFAAATVLRVKADGSRSYEPVSRFDPGLNEVVPVPIDLGPDWGNASDQVYLILFGTGIRHRSSLSAVALDIGGVPIESLYAGPQGDFAGLDQINLLLPRSLVSHGEVTINLMMDGKAGNPVTVFVK